MINLKRKLKKNSYEIIIYLYHHYHYFFSFLGLLVINGSNGCLRFICKNIVLSPSILVANVPSGFKIITFNELIYTGSGPRFSNGISDYIPAEVYEFTV